MNCFVPLPATIQTAEAMPLSFWFLCPQQESNLYATTRKSIFII
jgi:hypothetical protein